MWASWLFYSFPTLLLLLITWKLSIKPKRNLPPSPAVALPVIGHLHLLKFPIHRTLQRFSDKVGPIFHLRLGVRRLVVVSSPALVEECFTKNDIVLAARPRMLLSKYVGYDWTTQVGTSYGDHWRNLRRLTTTEIFSSARLAVFQSIREDEVRILVREIGRNSRYDFARVELRPLFSALSFNIIMRTVAGKRYFGEDGGGDEEAREFRELIEEIFEQGGISNPVDFVPALRWIDFKGIENKLKILGGKTDHFLQFLIDEKRREKGGITMIDHLLSLQKSNGEYYTDTIIKGIMLDLLVAGTDTSAVTLEWAMSALLNHPEKLDRARAEINDVSIDRLMTESDISKLPYLQNIISETFRLYTTVPLLLPHEASDDCKIDGYDIPCGTMVMVNAWAIHRDPTIWEDPKSFRPERFEAAEEVGPTKLMPFGLGRRSCPGNGLANRVIGLALGSLIQAFEWRRVTDDLVDMAEERGLSMPKVVPLEAMCKAQGILHEGD